MNGHAALGTVLAVLAVLAMTYAAVLCVAAIPEAVKEGSGADRWYRQGIYALAVGMFCQVGLLALVFRLVGVI